LSAIFAAELCKGCDAFLTTKQSDHNISAVPLDIE
jgi:hypothetical protein